MLNFSGGMDSTYVLYHWLKNNPRERILLHHVNLHHVNENRLKHEQEAVKNILEWLRAKGLKNYDYFESSFSYGNLPRISIKDIQIVALFSGIILRTQGWKSINTVLLSWHQGEVNREDINKGYRIRKMFDALEIDRPINFVFPIENMTRRQMADDMPEELLRLCHSCRKPQRNRKNCGQCNTCLEMKEAKIFNIVGNDKNKTK
jgi:7-cyano-7-deazaguanine synthase in queuosine biosynthesis